MASRSRAATPTSESLRRPGRDMGEGMPRTLHYKFTDAHIFRYVINSRADRQADRQTDRETMAQDRLPCAHTHTVDAHNPNTCLKPLPSQWPASSTRSSNARHAHTPCYFAASCCRSRQNTQDRGLKVNAPGSQFHLLAKAGRPVGIC